MILLIFFSTLIFLSYFICFLGVFEEISDVILASISLSCLQVILSEIILGLIGNMYANQIFAINTLISVLLFYCYKKIFPLVTLLRVNYDFFKAPQNILFFQLVIIEYAFIIFLSYIIPPYAWDSLTYHLPPIFYWIKAGRLFLIQPLSATSFYPLNGSLLMLWLYLTTKNMHVLNMIQIPFAFTLGLASFSVAKKLNISNAFKVIPIVLLTPVIMLLCSVAYVDVIFSCFILIAINFTIGFSGFNVSHIIL